MAIILIILQIISAIPTIIKIVKEIIDLIHGLPLNERKGARGELLGIVEDIQKGVTDPSHRNRLQELRDRIRSRQATA